MEVGSFYLPVIGSREEIEKGMAGKRTDLYQQMLKEVSEQVQYMDEHGYYGMGTTEHHFHIEGEEVSTNPVLLNLYFGMQTKNMKFGQLGNVLPAHNPVRLAEDIAMVDQMLGGRVFAGFARGYQPRWVATLGQQIDGMASETELGPEAYDAFKNELYYDHFDIIMKAWGNDTFSHKSKHWEIPPANTYWATEDLTRKYGQGVDENGILTEIGIAPPTYNKRMPDLFQPFSVSEGSIVWAQENDVTPVTIITNTAVAQSHIRAAKEAADKANKPYRMGMTREVIVADTDEEAYEIAKNGGSYIWCNFFGPFGFNAAVANPGEGPFDVPNNFETMLERGLVICGSPDTVKRKLEKLFTDLPCDYFWLFTYNGLISQKNMMRHYELLTEQVLPHFTDRIK
ncbi:MAG: flavin-dependent oxidoreductase [Gammaproteobacteria bacterium]|nr:MAG: flavin-dependent oxidoreductase [Gammaproteobacteria bacterium]